ncbi:sulfoxide reductase heme-binding subunit YedZ [Cryobacterium sp. MP_M5]|uniref:ferric reductase-like transmembrane domain-containing protein n=1 Tax=unclassified Cryobacterium TaxID=2649013 RepID=UPI001A2ED0D1|nr:MULTISPECIES: ferric reductase-like transmembrane domain-containing protein [unclassified Cryobacterium]MBG6057399.1 sulfoxide reductase heme-binding subunit YedZ [Cryobacterium sp. MP_M3]MEC5175598.1 sulfoxide reductase heme-binding subunit YedZ [Cryobacterium sp. MP_M5]
MNEALWALGRSTGVVALALITVSVLLGIVNRSGRSPAGLPRFSVALVHRNVSLLATVFLGVHLLSLLGDSYAQLRLVDFVVPFLGAAKPFWLGLGTVAVDLLIAVVVTGLLRRRVGVRVFRAVHWLTYLLWPVALAHSIGNGTDAGQAWFVIFALACVASVGAAVLWRLTPGFVEFRSVRMEQRP